MLAGHHAVCLRQVESHHPMRMAFKIGQLLPLHAGAGQRMLLAHAPSAVVEHVLAQPTLPAAGPNRSRSAIARELEQVRRQRFLVSTGSSPMVPLRSRCRSSPMVRLPARSPRPARRTVAAQRGRPPPAASSSTSAAGCRTRSARGAPAPRTRPCARPDHDGTCPIDPHAPSHAVQRGHHGQQNRRRRRRGRWRTTDPCRPARGRQARRAGPPGTRRRHPDAAQPRLGSRRCAARSGRLGGVDLQHQHRLRLAGRTRGVPASRHGRRAVPPAGPVQRLRGGTLAHR